MTRTFPGWCIRCMTWVETATGMCPVCGASTLADVPKDMQKEDGPKFPMMGNDQYGGDLANLLPRPIPPAQRLDPAAMEKRIAELERRQQLDARWIETLQDRFGDLAARVLKLEAAQRVQ